MEFDQKMAAHKESLELYVREQAKIAEESATNRAEALLVAHFWSLGEQLRGELGTSHAALERLQGRCAAIDARCASVEGFYAEVSQRMSDLESWIANTEQRLPYAQEDSGVQIQAHAQLKGLEAQVSSVFKQLKEQSEIIESYGEFNKHHTAIAKQQLSDLESKMATMQEQTSLSINKVELVEENRSRGARHSELQARLTAKVHGVEAQIANLLQEQAATRKELQAQSGLVESHNASQSVLQRLECHQTATDERLSNLEKSITSMDQLASRSTESLDVDGVLK